MKQLIRLEEPESFFKNEKKTEFYKDLRDSNGKIRNRWNLPTYQEDIKKVLFNTTNGECAFCSRKVGDSDFDVEHYFPKEQFPYLAYSFENYLCSCKHCNQSLKKTYYPKSLDSIKQSLRESILVNEIDGIIAYNKKEILDKTTDRIIEPTFDNIEEHLEFEPLSCTYLVKNNSSIGEETYKMFFNHREVVDYLQSINKQIMKMVMEGNSKDTILDLGLICGYSFYIEKFYEYWTKFFT